MGAFKSLSINDFRFFGVKSCKISNNFASRSHVDLGLWYTQRIFRVAFLIPMVDISTSVKGVPSCVAYGIQEGSLLYSNKYAYN